MDRNPNFFVSKTRLAVRNLPKNLDDKKLKNVFIEAILASPAAAQEGFNKKIRVKQVPSSTPHAHGPGLVSKWRCGYQVKIVRAEDEKSKGFGFIEFYEHEHALAALREVHALHQW